MSKFPIPEGILQSHTIIFGMTGAGKSSVARLCVEHLLDEAKAHPLLDNVPLTIIDPKGDWWGLRSSADGKGKGYPMVIFGGDHGDLPLAAEAGAAVADAVLSGAYTSLVDMSLLTLGERTRFYTDFATAYYRARTPRRLVIDEVHNFVPKGKIPDPQVSKMLHISNTIAAEGRGRGITMIAASQRPQKVHNDFSSSCTTLIAMKAMHPADRAAYKDWLDGTGDKAAASEILSSAAALTKGTGWVWCVGDVPFGPTKVAFPKYKTYDSFKPQSASAVVTGKALPDLDKLREQMAAYLEQRKLNDPVELKKRIRELEASIGKAQLSQPIEQQVSEEVAREAMADGWEKGFDAGAKKARADLVQLVASCFGQISEQVDKFGVTALHNLKSMPETFIDPMPKYEYKQLMPTFAKSIEKPRPNNPLVPAAKLFDAAARTAEDGLTKGHQKILDALLWLNEAGYFRPSREQLSAIAHYRGGAYGRSLGELKTRGLVVFPEGGTVTITPLGMSLAMLDTSGMTMTQRWRAALKKDGHRKIFDGLLDGGMTRDELSKKIGYSGGAYGRAIGEMFTMGALVYPEPGSVRLSESVLG